jgi:hypothetical protein
MVTTVCVFLVVSGLYRMKFRGITEVHNYIYNLSTYYNSGLLVLLERVRKEVLSQMLSGLIRGSTLAKLISVKD